MWVYTKLYCVLIVGLTWFCALLVDRSVPYFPIEISRTAAGGRYSLIVFRYGIASILPVILYEYYQTGFSQPLLMTPLPLWPCILIAAWFEDYQHLVLHGAGVLAMFALVCANVLLYGDTTRRVPVLACALMIETLRMGMKGFIVMFTEFDNSVWDVKVYMYALLNVGGLRDRIVTHILNIMFLGVDYCMIPQLTLPVLRVTGLLQWIAFYLMMSLY